MHYRPITPTDHRGAILAMSQPAYHGGGAGPINYDLLDAGGAECRARDLARAELDRAEQAARRARTEASMRRGQERADALAERARLEEEVAVARRKYEAAAEAYGNAQEAHLGF